MADAIVRIFTGAAPGRTVTTEQLAELRNHGIRRELNDTRHAMHKAVKDLYNGDREPPANFEDVSRPERRQIFLTFGRDDCTEEQWATFGPGLHAYMFAYAKAAKAPRDDIEGQAYWSLSLEECRRFTNHWRDQVVVPLLLQALDVHLRTVLAVTHLALPFPPGPYPPPPIPGPVVALAIANRVRVRNVHFECKSE